MRKVYKIFRFDCYQTEITYFALDRPSQLIIIRNQSNMFDYLQFEITTKEIFDKGKKIYYCSF